LIAALQHHSFFRAARHPDIAFKSLILVNPRTRFAASKGAILQENSMRVSTYYNPAAFPLGRMLCALTLIIAHPTLAEEGANPTTMAFAAGGAIRLKLNTGDMEIVGVDANQITVSWRSDRGDDSEAGRVKVRLRRLAEKEASVLVDGPGDRVRYRIEIPRRSDVAIHMHAGELKVRGIAGSMDVDLLAGEMELRLGDPRRYRKVAASVTAGELDAKPWQTDKAGLWRSFKLDGEGDYDLRARLIAGQLTIRAE
jgi:hypothetical protein